ncbi:DUF6221 family protein [Streptomyces canus]|uniref:DUF6221 family protein n=1 Tax=Streptomyces canus TaxID=58343 RepID=UPI002257370C|nr:DUF6221 family protein [Streptomyces canus]MCX5253673.1 DUF6221 family protein [Streptomyces canus]
MRPPDYVAFRRWISDQLDEDERITRAVEDRSAPWDGQWMADGNSAVRTVNGHVLFYRHDSGPLKPGLADHVAEWDPARVLREIEAKRQMVRKIHVHHRAPEWDEPEALGFQCRQCRDGRFPCQTLRLIAYPYSDRPGYQEAWRP